MHTRLLAAAAAILFTAITPSLAQAHDHNGWGGGRGYMRELREACDWGNRRACVRLGREIEQRRDARRQWAPPPPPPWARDPWRDPRWDPYRRPW
ncbi:hypothetical protein [Azospirillum sp.]|uniref:hypothetical protein n=1 Tax=Azospirillum sp. TaxID=34012 RepID=UPI003D7065A3